MNKNTQVVPYQGNDKLLLGIVLGVITFWLFAQTTLNIAPTMQAELGITENWSNIAVSITALFSGIFIVVMGGLGDRIGRVKITILGTFLSIIGSLLIAMTPAGTVNYPRSFCRLHYALYLGTYQSLLRWSRSSTCS